MLSLVTGGCGFIGSHLVKKLLSIGHRVVVIDDLSSGKIENIPIGHPNLIFLKENLVNVDKIRKILQEYKFDFIFHLAAIPSVQRSIEDPIYTHKVNLDVTLYLLEEAKKQTKLKRFVFASSAAVYGNDPSLPKEETSPIKPISPYGIDKYCAEQFVLQYWQIYGLPTVALRYFNVYGPNQDPSSPYAGVISLFTKEFLSKDIPEIKIYGNGKQTRDFIFVKDVVKANILVTETENAVGEVFNVGTSKETSLIEIVKILEDLTGKTAIISFLPERKGDIKRSVASINKIRKIGFKPNYDIIFGLKKLLYQKETTYDRALKHSNKSSYRCWERNPKSL